MEKSDFRHCWEFLKFLLCGMFSNQDVQYAAYCCHWQITSGHLFHHWFVITPGDAGRPMEPFRGKYLALASFLHYSPSHPAGLKRKPELHVAVVRKECHRR